MKIMLNESYNNVCAQAGLTLQEQQKMLEYIEGAGDDFYDTPIYEKLFDYFAFETGEMPYGIAKARTGDPDTWILERLEECSV